MSLMKKKDNISLSSPLSSWADLDTFWTTKRRIITVNFSRGSSGDYKGR